jgi:protein-disulfide isomerase
MAGTGKQRQRKPQTGQTATGKGSGARAQGGQGATGAPAGRRSGGSAAENRRVQRVLAERRARRNALLLKVGGAAAMAIVVVVALVLVNSLRDGNDGQALVIPTAPAAEVASAGRTKGDPNAPVTVLAFGDYQCPACGIFAREIEHQLIADFVATGQVYYQYEEFAFLGQESTDAAKAAVCADQQGKYWDYHRTLYFNQHGEGQGAFSRSRLNQMADAVGLDRGAFNSCMSDPQTAAEVQRMYNEGRANGIDSTPSFLINGTKVSGANYAPLRAAIEAELAKR